MSSSGPVSGYHTSHVSDSFPLLEPPGKAGVLRHRDRPGHLRGGLGGKQVLRRGHDLNLVLQQVGGGGELPVPRHDGVRLDLPDRSWRSPRRFAGVNDLTGAVVDDFLLSVLNCRGLFLERRQKGN